MVWWGILLLVLMAAAFVAISVYVMFKPNAIVLFVMIILYWGLVAGSGGVAWNLHNKCDTFEPGTDSAGLNAGAVVMTIVGAIAFFVVILLKILHSLKKFNPESRIAHLFEAHDTKKGHTAMIIMLVILACALATSGALGEVMYSKCQTWDPDDDPDTISGQRWFEVTTIACAGLVLLGPLVVIAVRHYRKAKAERKTKSMYMGAHPINDPRIQKQMTGAAPMPMPAPAPAAVPAPAAMPTTSSSSADLATIRAQQAQIAQMQQQQQVLAQQHAAAQALAERNAAASAQSAAAAAAAQQKLGNIRRRVTRIQAMRQAAKAKAQALSADRERASYLASQMPDVPATPLPPPSGGPGAGTGGLE